jgi:hypothetical protein
MVETADDDWPKLTFVLEHEGPIPLAEFTIALQRLAQRYAREARIAAPQEEPKLYIAEIRKGSVVVDFVTQHAYAIGGGAALALAGAYGVAEKANTLIAFGKSLKKLVDHFTGKKSAEEITKTDCDDMRALAAPVMHTQNAQIIINYNGGTQELVRLDEATAREADNRAAIQRLRLTAQEENVKLGVLMVWDQVRDAPAVEAGRSPDRGIISEIDPRPRQITFVSEDLKEQMGRRLVHPFEKAFVVDVKVLESPNGILGYRVLKLHDTLDRE